MDAITTKSLTKVFEVDNQLLIAVDDLSFTIAEGSIVAILGPNGAGKTTTVRIMASIFYPTKGEVSIRDLDVVENSLEVRSHIGIAHERPSFYERLSGRRNLQFYAELYDVPKDEIDTRIDEMAIQFDLEDAIDQPVASYSKGMRQKLSVAKALIHDPPILILDEPWSGLSPGATRDLRRKIQQLGTQGKTILITTHNLAQAEQVADHLLIISQGKLVALGTPAKLRAEYHLLFELTVRLDEKDANEYKELESLDGVRNVIREGTALKIEVENFGKTPGILKTMIEAGAQIHEVRENIPSLEDIYLNLVEVDA